MQKATPKKRDRHKVAFDAELTRLAEKFVELMLNPNHYAWLSHYFLLGGFTYPVLSAKALALDIAQAVERDFLVPKEVLDAVLERDRSKLIVLMKDRLKKTKLSPAYFERVLQVLNPPMLRKAIQEAESVFKLKRGPNPKIPLHKYSELAAWSDRLTPVIEKLLSELALGTKRPISDYLEFWKVEHPGACGFLLSHLDRFQIALNNPALRIRGTKVKSRARVLADALAGSDYNLSFLTSRDRASAARRFRSTSR
jgi:hypothetical protein